MKSWKNKLIYNNLCNFYAKLFKIGIGLPDVLYNQKYLCFFTSWLWCTQISFQLWLRKWEFVCLFKTGSKQLKQLIGTRFLDVIWPQILFASCQSLRFFRHIEPYLSWYISLACQNQHNQTNCNEASYYNTFNIPSKFAFSFYQILINFFYRIFQVDTQNIEALHYLVLTYLCKDTDYNQVINYC